MRPPESEQQTILFVTYGGGHVRIATAVRRELVARGWPVVILGLTTAGPYLQHEKIPFLGFSDFVVAGDSAALAQGEQLARMMNAADSGVAWKESVAYLGLSWADLVRSAGEEEAHRRLAQLGRHAFLPTGTLNRVLDRIRPAVVVTTNSPRAERAAVLAARERGIPTLSVVDLFGVRELYQLCSDRICVLSPLTTRYLVDKNGVDPASVVVTGNPTFDDLPEHRGPVDSKFRAEFLGATPDERCVLWIDQGGWNVLSESRIHHRSDEETVADLNFVSAITERVGARLFVRRHPNQPATLFQRWAAEHPQHLLVDMLPLYPLINSVDVVVTRTSTVGLEAALLGRPVISIDPEPGLTDLPVAQAGLALGGSSMADLEPLLRRVLDEPALREQLSTAYTRLPVDGRAAARVADEIVLLARECRL